MYQTSNEILDQIKMQREKMIDSAEKSGFTSEDTLRFSRELDKLIFEFQQKYEEEIRGNEIKFAMRQTMLIWPKVCY